MIKCFFLVSHYQFNHESAPYIHSFQFVDTAGHKSQILKGSNGLGRYEAAYSRHENCKLAYISGGITPDYLTTFTPHFECPVEVTFMPAAPLPASTLVAGVEAGSSLTGEPFSDEKLYHQHGPVTRIEIKSDTWINSIQAR